MRFQTVSPRFSSAEIHALMRATEGPPIVGLGVGLGVSTIEQLARELMDARAVVAAARKLHTADRMRTSDLEVLQRALSDYYGEQIP